METRHLFSNVLKKILNETTVVLILGGGKDYTGKGNRGKTGKQKKPKAEEKNKSNLLQMAESMAESLQSLNARLEEQQRQQQSLNSHGAGARPEECVTRDTNGLDE